MYESLRRSADFPKEKLAHFDGEGCEDLLYEMRNLGVNLRAATAEYIADNNLDAFVSSLASEPHLSSSACITMCAIWQAVTPHYITDILLADIPQAVSVWLHPDSVKR